ncbi:hypothetical protein [Amycolatopsis jejuensis]|uniref:hypothetical protein n=1 Tax=Amycolatopsis jejuensis TaxID=330084 RepID=UPI0005276180|nr:hypothetical protein [Amycolatopsis jejuensis]
MYTQTPAEALVTRLLIALDRTELDDWGHRLFATDATLHVDGGHERIDLHGPAEIIAKYLSRLPETADGPSILAGVGVALADTGATLAFAQAGEPHELFLHVDGGKIDELWSYPAGAMPREAAEAREAPAAAHHGGSCCG